jgi:hypothetical protein
MTGFHKRADKIDAHLAAIKWMLGFLIAGVASLVVKAFV